MKFIVDQQLPPALADWLMARGHEAQHVRDLGMKEAQDGEIWRHAEGITAAIVTKDEDFAARRARSRSGPAIVWLRFGNTTRPILLDRLARVWPDVEAALRAQAPVIEVR